MNLEENMGFKAINMPRKGRKLVVIDIDETIYDRKATSSYAAERQFLHEFLESVYEDYDIGIWSATSMKAIERKLQVLNVSNHLGYKILFYVDINAMIPISVGCRKIFVSNLQLLLIMINVCY